MSKLAFSLRAVVALVIVAAGLQIVPSASASTPPTKDCEIDFVPDNVSIYSDLYMGMSNIVGSGGGRHAATVMPNGNLGLSITEKRFGTTGTDQVMKGIGSNCASLWSQPLTCTTTVICTKYPMATDPSSNLFTLKKVSGTPTWTQQYIDGSTGNLVQIGGSPQEISMNGNLGCTDSTFLPTAGVSYYNAATTEMRFALEGQCATAAIQISTPSAHLSTLGITSTIGDISVEKTATPAFFYGTGATSTQDTLYKIDVTTGSNSATLLTDSTRCLSGAAHDQAPGTGSSHVGDLLKVTTIGSSACTSTTHWGYKRVNGAAFTTTESGDFGVLTDNLWPVSYAISGEDSILACGAGSLSGTAHITRLVPDATTPSIDWSVSNNPSTNTAGTCDGIAFDGGTGFYVWGNYLVSGGAANGKTAVYIQHWTGGGMTQPTQIAGLPDFSITPEAPSGLVATVTVTQPTSGSSGDRIQLRWPLSANDPDQDVGTFDYRLYINGGFQAVDDVTGLDGDGQRFHEFTISRSDHQPADYVMWVVPRYLTNEGPPSCSVTINDGTLNTKTCGSGAIGGQSQAVIPGANSDLAGGVKGFCAGLMGSSTGSLFFCGLVFVVVGFLALAAAFASLTQTRGLPTALAGAVAGFGVMLFNVFASIWEVWAGVVLIMLCAGIIAWMVRKMTLSFAGGGGGGGESS